MRSPPLPPLPPSPGTAPPPDRPHLSFCPPGPQRSPPTPFQVTNPNPPRLHPCCLPPMPLPPLADIGRPLGPPPRGHLSGRPPGGRFFPEVVLCLATECYFVMKPQRQLSIPKLHQKKMSDRGSSNRAVNHDKRDLHPQPSCVQRQSEHSARVLLSPFPCLSAISPGKGGHPLGGWWSCGSCGPAGPSLIGERIGTVSCGQHLCPIRTGDAGVPVLTTQ